jgi:hypothetical protein
MNTCMATSNGNSPHMHERRGVKPTPLKAHSSEQMGIATKTCLRCGETYPMTDFYPNGKGEYRPECKHCYKIRRNAIYKPVKKRETEYKPSPKHVRAFVHDLDNDFVGYKFVLIPQPSSGLWGVQWPTWSEA